MELGLRALVVLTASFPRSFDIDRLVLMDYCLLHSADLGGPPSVLPPVPTRGGELGVKRSVLEHGVQVMARAQMVDLVATADGLTYRASEEAAPFLRLVDSPLVRSLSEIAAWAASEFSDLPTDEVRDRIRAIADRWTEQWTDEFPSWFGPGPDDEETLL
ncbi:ABC-three component system middle component 2 [Jiangella alkaliphila]|uniref:ABC-three component system middle component 2 n=1 Tax=Jiangella alkaliphila TaxID=419479 RepID=UPI00128CD1E9|nr:ABC-three component system middle component 2 [Jiangella alkaliphila]